MTLAVPQVVVEIGEAQYDDVLAIVVREELGAVSMARVTLDLAESTPELLEGTSVRVYCGWWDGLALIHDGALAQPARGEFAELRAADSVAARLRSASVVRAWKRTRPDVVARDLCAVAGVELDADSEARLAGLPERLRWVQPAEDALAALEHLVRAWAPGWQVHCDGTLGHVWIGPPVEHPRRRHRVVLRSESVVEIEVPDGATTGRATLLPMVDLRPGVSVVVDGRDGLVRRVTHRAEPAPRQEIEWTWLD